MNESIYYWVWLSRIKKLGSIKIQNLLNVYKTPKRLFKCTKDELMSVYGIGEETANEIIKEEYKIGLEKYIKYMKENNIELICYDSKYYPQKLNQIYDKPLYLYIKGNKEILNKFSLAIIGCRNYSTYGKQMAIKFSEGLSKNGIITVSGLANGIDSFAHIGSVKQKQKTIAVIGNRIR